MTERTPPVHVDARGAQGPVIGDYGTVHNHFDTGRKRLVLVGYTAELAQHPSSKSFVAAADSAVRRAGYEFNQLGDWAGARKPTAPEYRERVREFDVYISLLGFRYGPRVGGDRSPSYARLQFDTAVESRRPHLVFVIMAGEYPAPHSFFFDDAPGQPQQAFRNRVLADDNLAKHQVTDPSQLEDLLVDLLRNPRQPARTRTEPAAVATVDVQAGLVALSLGAAGFLVLSLGLNMSLGWAAGIAGLATVGTYLGGLRGPVTTSPSPD